jgi:hypothetical protein
MRKYAAATALVIALNITMLTPAVLAGDWRFLMAQNEGGCDSTARGLREWANRCHCSFECYRKHSYTIRMSCNPGQPGWPGGLCNFHTLAIETAHACLNTCLKAKGAPLPRPESPPQ